MFLNKKEKQFFQSVNYARYRHQQEGHYESYYQRANHPTQPLAFWTRYTIFSPKKHPEKAIGELWGIFFNGLTNKHVAIKQEFPLSACIFDNEKFFVRVGESGIEPGRLHGNLKSEAASLSWDLEYFSDQKPALLIEIPYFTRKFPVAKSLCGSPLAKFRGFFEVNGEKHQVSDWIGSENHNWGRKHTDEYAFAQVEGFDNSPRTVFHAVTARMKFGPFMTPPMTPAVLRHQGEEFIFYKVSQAICAKGKYHFFDWKFQVQNSDLEVEGRVWAPREKFVALTYYNPPGGIKHCLNSKIAFCELKLRWKKKHEPQEEILTTQHRSLFEIVTSNFHHGVPLSV